MTEREPISHEGRNPCRPKTASIKKGNPKLAKVAPRQRERKKSNEKLKSGKQNFESKVNGRRGRRGDGKAEDKGAGKLGPNIEPNVVGGGGQTPKKGKKGSRAVSLKRPEQREKDRRGFLTGGCV